MILCPQAVTYVTAIVFKWSYDTYIIKSKLGGRSMKGKVVFIPVLIVSVLISIFIFNGFQKSDDGILTTKKGAFIESSGMVESNALCLSSEVIGIIDEILVQEGDEVKIGQIIAKINNTNLNNQYEQSLVGLKLSEKNLETIGDKIENFDSQNTKIIEQAKSGYMAIQGEYEKTIEGASEEEVQLAQESVNQAKMNLDFMENNLKTSKELLENQVISQSVYDEAELNYNVASAQYNGANSKLDLIKSQPSDGTIKAVKNKVLQAKAGYELTISKGSTELIQLKNQYETAQIQVEQAQILAQQLKVELDKTVIKSPIDGVVNLLIVKKGEFIQLGKPIAEIYDPNNIEIKVYVSESNIGNVKVGQDVNIFVDGDGEQTYKGRVIKINNKAEFTPKNIQTKEERVNTVFEVKIQAVDSQRVIKAGMPVDVNIKIDELID